MCPLIPVAGVRHALHREAGIESESESEENKGIEIHMDSSRNALTHLN